MRFKTFARNTLGRDYVIGDLHGEYGELREALARIGFDPSRDRLFPVGDLIDRGAHSLTCLKLLAQPWVEATCGNHEAMFLELYADGEPGQGAVEYVTNHNGMGWWRTITPAQRQDCLAAWRKMPIAIEIETHRGRVGIVHGEVPIGMHWNDFRAGIEAGDADLMQKAVWGRTRMERRDTSGVAGIDRVFVGHTPVNHPIRLGNIFYIDTGLVFGKLKGDPAVGRLSFHGLSDATVMLTAPSKADDFLDLRVSNEIVETPFGSYATL